MDNESKLLYFYIFGCQAYMYLPNEVHTNKLVPYSELMIFIEYEDNGYCFIYYTQENDIFYSIYAIFNKKFFPKYTDSYKKEYKLYTKLLDKISPETESSVSGISSIDKLASVSILYILFPLIQNNPSFYSYLLPFSYKSLFLSSLLVPKKAHSRD